MKVTFGKLVVGQKHNFFSKKKKKNTQAARARLSRFIFATFGERIHRRSFWFSNCACLLLLVSGIVAVLYIGTLVC